VKRIKISTNDLEGALDQIIRAKISGQKASISPTFIASTIKELIDRRNEDEENCRDIERLFFENEPLLKGKPVTVVEEVSTLSELGNTSWTTADEEADTHADTRCLPEFIVKAPKAPKARKPSLRSGVRARAAADRNSLRKWIAIALVIVIILTFSQVMFTFK
jgi:hypothetical protein